MKDKFIEIIKEVAEEYDVPEPTTDFVNKVSYLAYNRHGLCAASTLEDHAALCKAMDEFFERWHFDS